MSQSSKRLFRSFSQNTSRDISPMNPTPTPLIDFSSETSSGRIAYIPTTVGRLKARRSPGGGEGGGVESTD